MYNWKNWEEKNQNKETEASPREADEQRKHGMSKHWTHLPHPLKQHFVFHLNKTHFVGSVPSLPPTPLSAAIEDSAHSLLTYTCRAEVQIYNSHHHLLILISTACFALKFCSTVWVQEKKLNYLVTAEKMLSNLKMTINWKCFIAIMLMMLVSGGTFNVGNVGPALKNQMQLNNS